MAPTPESLAAMGGNGTDNIGKTHVQTTKSWIRLTSPYSFTSEEEWTIAFSGAALFKADGSNIVLGSRASSNCNLCRIEYFQHDDYHQGQSLLTFVSDGDDPWEATDLSLPLATNEFHVLTLTQANGLLRIYQNTTKVIELYSVDAWLDLSYVGHLDHPLPWFPGFDGHIAVHRVVHAPGAIDEGVAIDKFVKFMSA